MTQRRFVIPHSSPLRWSSCCLFLWTSMTLLWVVRGRLIEDSSQRPPQVTLKSPTTCRVRPSYCRLKKEMPIMPWSCPSKDCPFSRNTYRFDRNSEENSTLSGNLSYTIYYPEVIDNGTKLCLQGLNLTWTVKLNESDVPVVGFRLQYTRIMPSKNVNLTTSVSFFLRPGRDMAVDKNGNTMFYYDCVVLSIASKYNLELFSLHQSRDNKPEGLERRIGFLNLSTNCDIYPEGHFMPPNSTYKGFINVSPLNSDCSIIAYFSPASPAFGFRAYDVHLISNNKIIMKELNLTFTCENFGPVIFRNVQPGNYKLQVMPVGGRCDYCQKDHSSDYCPEFKECGGFQKQFNVSESDYLCQTTAASTNMLTMFTSYPTPEHAPTATPEHAPIVVVESTSKVAIDVKSQNVIVAVAASIVAVVLVVAAFVVYRFRSRKRRGVMTVSTNYDDGKDIPEDGLTPQSVLLVYAGDNRFHSEVVTRLAIYLQTQCHCDVRFDQWSQAKISEVSALDWIFHQLKSVKNVVIINSEAGFHQYSANEQDVTYEKIYPPETPLDDMFLPAMRELRTEYFRKPKSRKLLRVAFPYTDPKFFINDFHSDLTYLLMSHIDDLVLTIHGRSKRSKKGKASMGNINEKDYTKCSEGHELEKAIQEATEYYKQNPRWFSNSYQIKPGNDQNNVDLSVDKGLIEGHCTLQHDCCHNDLDSLSSVYFDSGLGRSIEKEQMFKAPNLEDDSSVSSANVELQIVMLNEAYDSTLT